LTEQIEPAITQLSTEGVTEIRLGKSWGIPVIVITRSGRASRVYTVKEWRNRHSAALGTLYQAIIKLRQSLHCLSLADLGRTCGFAVQEFKYPPSVGECYFSIYRELQPRSESFGWPLILGQTVVHTMSGTEYHIDIEGVKTERDSSRRIIARIIKIGEQSLAADVRVEILHMGSIVVMRQDLQPRGV